MTVQQLIDALTALPDDQKSLEVVFQEEGSYNWGVRVRKVRVGGAGDWREVPPDAPGEDVLSLTG